MRRYRRHLACRCIFCGKWCECDCTDGLDRIVEESSGIDLEIYPIHRQDSLMIRLTRLLFPEEEEKESELEPAAEPTLSSV